MKTLALINEKSGAVSAVGVKNCINHLYEHSGREDIDIEIAAGEPQSLIDCAQSATERRDIDEAIVIGGDGTIAAIAGVLSNTDIPMAPLPGGTMNAFSRDLGYDGDLLTAIEQLSSVAPLAVDIAYAGRFAFLNNVVFGTYTSVAESRERIRDVETIGEKMEAITEVIGALAHSDSESYRITADGDSEDVVTNTLMVSNNLYAGAELLRPVRERVNAGVLGLYVANSTSPFDFLTVLAEAVSGGLADPEQMIVRECKTCRIASQSASVEITIDGEAMELPSPIDISIKPRGLQALAP